MNSEHHDTTTVPTRDRRVWTEEAIRALGAVTDLPTAASIFGLGRALAYELAKNDEFPVPVIRAGTRYRVPVAAILTALRLPPAGATCHVPDPERGSPPGNQQHPPAAPDHVDEENR
jgi:hypothetical protein